MLFEIEHRIDYTYDRPVFIEPLTLRILPQDGPAQRRLAFDLTIEPTPAGIADALDAAGNVAHTVWFVGETRHLAIAARATVETYRSDPFDYLVTNPRALMLPMAYDPASAALLAPALAEPERSLELDALAERLAGEAGYQTLTYLYNLCGWLYREMEPEVRHEGPALAPGATMARRRGSCRDLAVLFNDLCRRQGIAARFVSGYKFEDSEADADSELHAWSEVYLPGGGWRGYDPSAGLAVADRHIALASAPEPAGAAPTDGTFRGTGAHATMTPHVRITRLDGDVDRATPGQRETRLHGLG